MAEKVKYTFNTSPLGKSAGQGISMSNWVRVSQDGSGVNTIVNGNETNRMLMQTPQGLWTTTFKTDITYSDCDFTAFINSPNVFMSPRASFDDAVAPTGFGAQITPSSGSISIYKNCFGSRGSFANFSISPFSNEFKARVTIVGYVLSVYINDVFIGDFDFTGSGISFCGFDGPLSGFVGMTTFDSLVTWDSGDKTPNYVITKGI